MKLKKEIQIEQYNALIKQIDKENLSLTEIKNLLKEIKTRTAKDEAEKVVLTSRIYVYKFIIEEINAKAKPKGTSWGDPDNDLFTYQFYDSASLGVIS